MNRLYWHNWKNRSNTFNKDLIEKEQKISQLELNIKQITSDKDQTI